jgi:AAA domain
MHAPTQLYGSEGPPLWDEDGNASPRPAPTGGLATIALGAFLAEEDSADTDLVVGLGLPDVGVGVLAGPPKSFKTLLAIQLAICLSTGGGTAPLPFLGLDVPRGGSVLFVEEEGGRRKLRERLRRQIDGLEADDPAIELLLFSDLRLDNPRAVARIGDAMRSNRHVAGILDPFGFMHGQDENKPSDMAPIMRHLNRAATDARALLLALHHVTKPQAGRPTGRLGDRIRGASSITAGVDSLFVLERVAERDARLRGESRDAEPIDIHLKFDDVTLLLTPTEEPAQTSGRAGTEKMVADDELLAFAAAKGRIAAADVMKRFDVKSRATALSYLKAHPGLEVVDNGPRDTLWFGVKG